MVGVDLSVAMLMQARAKGLYDRLVEDEVQRYLLEEAQIGAHYHLVLAADVFMYFDDLGPVLKAAAQVVVPAGQLAFSVETYNGDGVLLRDTLRYAHGEAYVQKAVSGAGLKLVSLHTVPTRTEKNVPVPGLIVLAKR
jgi:predicted TPR repeat methyltransferase